MVAMRKALQKDESPRQKCVDTAKAIFVGVDTKHKVTFINKEGCKLLGYKEKEIVGKDWFENFVPPRIRGRAKTTFNNLIAGKSELVEYHEGLVLTRSGGEINIAWHNALLRDEYGKIQAVLSSGEDCSARKQMEKQLRNLAETNESSAKEWQKTFDAALDIIALISPDFRILKINRAGCEALAKEPEELLGRKCYEVVHGLDCPIDGCPCVETVKTKEAGSGEITDHGRHYIVTAAPVLDENNELMSFVHTIKDITGRKHMEEVLEESEQRFRAIFEGATDGILAADVGTKRFVHANPRISEITGYSLEELLKLDVAKIHPEEDLPYVLHQFDKLAKGRMTLAKNIPVLRKDKKVVYCDISSKVIRIGKQECLVGFFRDIGDRKKAEEEEERLLHDLAERVKELNCLYGFSKLVARPDISVEEILQETVNLIPPSWQYPDITCSRIVFKEKEFKTKNFKAAKWKQLADIKVFGKRTGILEVCYLDEKPESYEGPFLKEERDLVNVIAERLGQTIESKKAEEELKSSEERFKILFELAPDGYYLNDLKGNFIDGNKVAENMIGHKREELLGKSFLKLKLLAPEQILKAAKGLAMNALGRPTGPDEFTLLRKDGSKVPVEIKTFPVKIKGQSLVLGIARDITDRKEQEKQLAYLATHDHLSGLPNRRSLENVLKRAVARARRGAKSALLFIDMDNFKHVNDNFGHMAGDKVLIALARLLQKSLRIESFLARLGGDEFAIWLEQVDILEAQAVAERIRRTVEEHTFNISKHQFKLSISIGVTVIEGKQDLWELMSQADTAMYKAKEKGRNQVCALQAVVRLT